MSSYAAFRHLTLDDITQDTEGGKQQNECLADVIERKVPAICCQAEQQSPS